MPLESTEGGEKVGVMRTLSRAGRAGIAILVIILVATVANAQLDERCVITILNRTVQVAAGGGWSLPNVPSNQGQIRARATCINEDGD
jgi:hypothetical protein